MAEELLGLAQGFLLPIPLLHQGINDGALFLLAEMHHGAAGIVLYAVYLLKAGVSGVISVEGFRDGGGD